MQEFYDNKGTHARAHTRARGYPPPPRMSLLNMPPVPTHMRTHESKDRDEWRTMLVRPVQAYQFRRQTAGAFPRQCRLALSLHASTIPPPQEGKETVTEQVGEKKKEETARDTDVAVSDDVQEASQNTESEAVKAKGPSKAKDRGGETAGDKEAPAKRRGSVHPGAKPKSKRQGSLVPAERRKSVAGPPQERRKSVSTQRKPSVAKGLRRGSGAKAKAADEPPPEKAEADKPPPEKAEADKPPPEKAEPAVERRTAHLAIVPPEAPATAAMDVQMRHLEAELAALQDAAGGPVNSGRAAAIAELQKDLDDLQQQHKAYDGLKTAEEWRMEYEAAATEARERASPKAADAAAAGPGPGAETAPRATSADGGPDRTTDDDGVPPPTTHGAGAGPSGETAEAEEAAAEEPEEPLEDTPAVSGFRADVSATLAELEALEAAVKGTAPSEEDVQQEAARVYRAETLRSELADVQQHLHAINQKHAALRQQQERVQRLREAGPGAAPPAGSDGSGAGAGEYEAAVKALEDLEFQIEMQEEVQGFRIKQLKKELELLREAPTAAAEGEGEAPGAEAAEAEVTAAVAMPFGEDFSANVTQAFEAHHIQSLQKKLLEATEALKVFGGVGCLSERSSLPPPRAFSGVSGAECFGP